MSRFQVGGLALIIKGCDHNKNVGKTVTLLEYLGETERLKDAWRISAEGLHLSNFDTNESWIGGKGSFVNIEKHRLIPLGDSKSMDDIRHEEMKHSHLEPFQMEILDE